jgi:SAM-dependent methyltransferase
MPNPKSNATTRFSDRVADYVKYRPHYPLEILDLLAARCDLTPESVIADVGSGTGILTKLFLENGNPVIGVEPNTDMREAAERYLADYARFTSVDGTAEATRLPKHAVDFVLVGQAFHWFDQDRTRAEFQRILKDGAGNEAERGWCVLVWNDRRVDTTPFLIDYEALLQRFATDYNEINHKNVQDASVFTAFFGGEFFEATFDNIQHFDFEGLMGRLNSSSYIPPRTDPKHPAIEKAAREIFEAHAVNGRVAFEYDTRVYCGRIV